MSQVFRLEETRPTAPERNTRLPVHVHKVLTSDECILNKKEELEKEKARDATKAKKEQGESGKIWVTHILYVVQHRVGNEFSATRVNSGCIRNVYLKLQQK